ncbi:hypothetical protein CONCODRAFT_80760 [Conidiobolus coronatus NRRL 28638]|uniref:SMP-LTD domain-containing protein n=1 Tax=Conidiobolus coronatus (strain ATCC 28846 / CBS 209.66 / NRRL 28638) TaxID=796925 RepID=A0A137NRX4_CONC2|nr:hypothetical protein CONCODRAFT_80760 [Conidiobolus coronatus NRRL 28638]|eukprot:KXN65486.1 hypothetical protein CONCODRAFT_80760 [Conidiobolus coronatus NRRL 28638]
MIYLYVLSIIWGSLVGLPFFLIFSLFSYWYWLPKYKPKVKTKNLPKVEDKVEFEFHSEHNPNLEPVELNLSPDNDDSDDARSISSWISVSPSDHIQDTRSLQQGWLRVTTTPKPSEDITVFQKAHHIMFQGWKGLSIPFLANNQSSESDSKQKSSETTAISRETVGVSGIATNLKKLNTSGNLVNPRVSRLIDETGPESSVLDYGDDPEYQSFIEENNGRFKDTESVKYKRLSTISEQTIDEDLSSSVSSQYPSLIDSSQEDINQSQKSITHRKPNDHRKCIDSRKFLHGWYYSLVKDSKLYLYQDETCSELNMILDLSHYDVTIYPYDLLEYELFFPQNPFLLAGHTGQDSALPATPTSQASSANRNQDYQPNYYVFAETSVEKEDWYHIFVQKCRHTFCCHPSLLNALDIPPIPFDPDNPEQLPAGVRVTAGTIIDSKYQLLRENVFKSQQKSNQETNSLMINLGDSDTTLQSTLDQPDTSNGGQSGIEIFNAVLGMIFLSMIQSEHLLMSLQLFLFRLIARWLPFFISVDLVDFDLGDQVPIFSDLPKMTKFDRMGELAIEIPLSYAAEMFFSFQIKLFHNPEPSPNYVQYTGNLSDNEEVIVEENREDLYVTFKWPKWMQMTFNLEFRFGIDPISEEDPAFSTTAHLKIFPPPTHRFWVGLTHLPPEDKVWAHVVINGRLFEIPKTLINKLLSDCEENVLLPNMKDITFFPSEWMVPTINPPPSWTDPLPRLMETLAKGKRNRKNSTSSKQNRKSAEVSPTIPPLTKQKSGLIGVIKKRISSTLDIIPQINNASKGSVPDRGTLSMSTSFKTQQFTPSDENSPFQFADTSPDFTSLILPVMPISQIQPISTLVHFDLQPPNAGNVEDLETSSPIATSKILLRLAQLESGIHAVDALPQAIPQLYASTTLPTMLRNKRGWRPIIKSTVPSSPENTPERTLSKSAPVSPQKNVFEKPLPALLNRLSIINLRGEDQVIEN